MKKLIVILLLPIMISCGVTETTTETNEEKRTEVNTTIDRDILKDTVTEIEIPQNLFRQIMGFKPLERPEAGMDTVNTIESDRSKQAQDVASSGEPVRIRITDKSKIETKEQKQKEVTEQSEVNQQITKDTRAFWQRPILMFIGLGIFVVIVGFGVLKYLKKW